MLLLRLQIMLILLEKSQIITERIFDISEKVNKKNWIFNKSKKKSKNNRKYGGSPTFSEKRDCFFKYVSPFFAMRNANGVLTSSL